PTPDYYAIKGEYQKAYDHYQNVYIAETSFEQKSRLNHNLSYCAYKMGKYSIALAHAETNLVCLTRMSVTYDYAKTHFRCAEALLKLKRYDEAKQHYENVLKKWNCTIVKNRLEYINTIIARSKSSTNEGTNAVQKNETASVSSLNHICPTYIHVS